MQLRYRDVVDPVSLSCPSKRVEHTSRVHQSVWSTLIASVIAYRALFASNYRTVHTGPVYRSVNPSQGKVTFEDVSKMGRSTQEQSVVSCWVGDQFPSIPLPTCNPSSVLSTLVASIKAS